MKPTPTGRLFIFNASLAPDVFVFYSGRVHAARAAIVLIEKINRYQLIDSLYNTPTQLKIESNRSYQ
jgi:hypothetical protein